MMSRWKACCSARAGWVSGLTSAFPQESIQLIEAVNAGDLDRARAIYRWFMPLLHLDAEHDLVQSIKLAETIMGRGSERVRPPRLPLAGERRRQVTAMVERAAATRPTLPQHRPAEPLYMPRQQPKGKRAWEYSASVSR